MSAVEKKIEAVEFLLASFFLIPTQAERMQSIAEKYLTNEHVAVYARFPEEALQHHVGFLQIHLSVSCWSSSMALFFF